MNEGMNASKDDNGVGLQLIVCCGCRRMCLVKSSLRLAVIIIEIPRMYKFSLKNRTLLIRKLRLFTFGARVTVGEASPISMLK